MSRRFGGGRPRKMQNARNLTTRIDEPLIIAADLLKLRSNSITYSRLLSTGIRAELERAGVRSDDVISNLEEHWRNVIQDAEDQLVKLAETKKRLSLSLISLHSSTYLDQNELEEIVDSSSQPSAYLREIQLDRQDRFSKKQNVIEEV